MVATRLHLLCANRSIISKSVRKLINQAIEAAAAVPACENNATFQNFESSQN